MYRPGLIGTGGCMARPLRTHQRMIDNLMRAIAAGETEVRDCLWAITPGGGKSLLPVISAARLIRAGVVDRVCWVVPRDSLRLQAEEAFADPGWREELGHGISIRAAENAPDLCRGLGGYVTTYQAIAAAPELHLAEFRRHRYLVAIDELHHLPAVNDMDPLSPASDETAWSRAIVPLLECARVRLLMSGTLERADGRAILWLPYRAQDRTAGKRKFRRIDFNSPGWAVVGYSRRQALAERAIIPVTFGAMDGEAEWRPRNRSSAPVPQGPVPISAEPDLARYALYTALRTEFADAMLREAFDACRAHRARRRLELGLPPGTNGRGLGKMLVVASDQEVARRYVERIASWMPRAEAGRSVRLAVSDARDAHECIAAFRLRHDPAVLVTVAMAYEGLDCPEVTHVTCLTHIRSRPWLEQMIARATRVDPAGGPYEQQAATVYHPDDILFRRFRHSIETEQGTRAALRSGKQRDLFDPDDEGDGERGWGLGIEPLHSEVTGLRFDTAAPGPDFGSVPRVEPRQAAAPGDAAEPGPPGEVPSSIERRLRQQVGQMVAGQVIEDEDNNAIPGGPVSYHAYNAVLKRALGGKSRSEMSLAELEAAVGWLERNRLGDHLDLIDDDQRYRWSSRRQRAMNRPPIAAGWVPPKAGPQALRPRAEKRQRRPAGTD